MAFDFKKLLLASVLPLGIGVVLVILAEILLTLSLIITDSNAETIDLVSTAYSFFMIPLFLALYLWCGLRAVKRFNFDAVGAGWVTAFTYFVTGLFNLFLNVIIQAVIVSRDIAGSGVGAAESVLASSLFGGITGLSGVGLSAFCGIAIIIFGTMTNFVVGGTGALYAIKKSSRYE